MSSAKLSHEDYEVAWICALPLEMTAATAILDRTHPNLPQSQSDYNTYTLGQVYDHNVVICCLPYGVYGTNSATAVISHLQHTFPCIEFALMVGIGGGVPSKTTDIRLGDVVVSKPTGTSGGVIQYDYGKTIQGGKHQQIGSLNKPPPVLLTAIAKLQASHLMERDHVSKILSSVLQDNTNLNPEFARPNEDRLFHVDYPHQDSDATCATCDNSQLVNRARRTTETPYIHYGLIASGNQVIKDGPTRDHIAQEIDILCFEMEAAGIMDQIPCLVIRGICDYCDSHKNKQWQGYAALAAAAYTKALFSIIPLHEKSKANHRKGRWMVPFKRNSRFVGRQAQLIDLEKKLLANDQTGRIAITGLGGVGKTQVVLELAYRLREMQPECSIFWIPSTSIESVEQAYLAIAQLLELEAVKTAEAKTRVQSYLSQEIAGQWLLIFDNADDSDMWMSSSDRSPALKTFLPHGEAGHVIFTTRNRKLAVKLASSEIVSIPEMDEETATKTFQKALIDPSLLDNYDTTIAFLNQLTFLPLAINQAAAYINENDLRLGDYISLMQEQEADVIELLSEDFEDEGRYADIQNPVATTWLISFRQLKKQNSLAGAYLSFMACVNPRDIPQSLLPQASSKKKMTDAIGLLNAYSFVVKQAESGHLSLHRLVYLATRGWLKKEGLVGKWLEKTADRLSEVFPNDNHQNRTLWREYLPHAQSMIQNEDFQKMKDRYGSLLQRVARCLDSDGRYNEAEALFSVMLKKKQKELGDNHPDTLISMAHLASIFWNQGRWTEAEKLDVQVTETRKRIFGVDHPLTLTSTSNLASTYRKQGRWAEAEQLEVQLMETAKRVFGAENPRTLTSMANLASTYWYQGRRMEAEKLEFEVLEKRKKVLGDEHPDTLSSMVSLASTYWHHRRREEAEKLDVQVLEIRMAVLGAEHPKTLSSMSSVASELRKRGHWTDAEKLELQVLETRKKLLGAEHPDTLDSMANLASTFQKQGRLIEGDKLEVEVLEKRKSVLGAEHPKTLSSMSDVASTLQKRGRWTDAEKLDLQVLETKKTVLGAKHPDTLDSMARLAFTYCHQGRWADAEKLELYVLETSKTVLGAEHPDTLTSMKNLSRIWKRQGRDNEALELIEACVELRKKRLGPTHPKTISTIAKLEEWKSL